MAKKLEMMTREIRADLTATENERQFKLSFSSEQHYERWFGTEILDHSEGCCDLTRLREIGCVLFNHDRDKVIARIVSCEIKDNRGEAVIEFDDDDFSETIRKKVEKGTLKGVSVGYRIFQKEEVKANMKSSDGRFAGPCVIAKKWEPYEISIVTIPADETVGVGRDMDDNVSMLPIYERQLEINKNKLGGKK